MPTNNDGIINFSIKLVRKDNEDGTIKTLYVSVRVLTTLEGLTIRDFSETDILNVGDPTEIGLLNLNIHAVTTNENHNSGNKELKLLTKIFTLNVADVKFFFDKEIYSVFIGNLNIPVSVGPVGTKRTVITYEDTDVIDDTKKV
jgi:hypothetical protein